MNVYEIINPSDPVTFEAPDDKVAIFAVLAVHGTRYGVTRDGDAVLPLLFLSIRTSDALESWLNDQGITGEWEAENLGAVADALDSAIVCSADNYASIRDAVRAGGGDVAIALRAFNESRRTSLNDICGRGYEAAARIRALLEEP